jgi:hypothetical protein
MTFKKFWRALRGHIDREEIERQVAPYVAPSVETARYEDNPDEYRQRKELQQHIDEANTVLYRFTMQQTLRRRQY